jgi:hypothetical protein
MIIDPLSIVTNDSKESLNLNKIFTNSHLDMALLPTTNIKTSVKFAYLYDKSTH